MNTSLSLFKRDLMKRTEQHLLLEIKKWSVKSANCLHLFNAPHIFLN